MGVCGSQDDPEFEICDTLMATPFGIRLSREQIAEFAKYWTRRRVEKGHTITYEGRRGGVFYVIAQGNVRITMNGALLCVKGEREYLGSCQDHACLTTAVAGSACTLIEITQDNLKAYRNDFKEMERIVLLLMKHEVGHLDDLPTFQGIDPELLRVLDSLLRPVYLETGDVLFDQGDLGNSLFLLITGSVQAIIKIPKDHDEEDDKDQKNDDNDGKIEILEDFDVKRIEMVPPEVFGELALIMDIPRTARIEATSPSVLLELPREVYEVFPVPWPTHMKRRLATHLGTYKVPFFEAIAKDKFFELAELCKVIQLQPDEVVFEEDSEGDAFYIVAHGKLQVSVKQEQEDGSVLDVPVAEMEGGKYFGEIALVQETKRTATITTLTKCTLFKITKSDFLEFFKEAPEVLADFEVKLARYGVQLRAVLHHPIGLQYFTKHLDREYSPENLNFWKACRAFRHLTPLDMPHDTEKSAFDEQDDDGLNMTPMSRIARRHTRAVSIAARALSQAGTTEEVNSRINIAFDWFSIKSANPEQTDRVLTSQGLKSLLDVLHTTFREDDFGGVWATLGGANKFSEISRSDFIYGVKNNVVIGKDPFAETLLFKLNAQIQREKLDKLQVTFQLADLNGNDQLDVDEFDTVLKQLNHDIDRKTLLEKFNALDVENLGYISFVQFCSFMMAERTQQGRFKRFIQKEAELLWAKYIDDKSPEQVNIPFTIMSALREEIAKGATVHTFEEAEKEIIKLMDTDSFRRFKNGDLFQEFLQSVESYTHVQEDVKEKKFISKMRRNTMDLPGASQEGISLDDLLVRLKSSRDSVKDSDNLPLSPETPALGSNENAEFSPSTTPNSSFSIPAAQTPSHAHRMSSRAGFGTSLEALKEEDYDEHHSEPPPNLMNSDNDDDGVLVNAASDKDLDLEEFAPRTRGGSSGAPIDDQHFSIGADSSDTKDQKQEEVSKAPLSIDTARCVELDNAVQNEPTTPTHNRPNTPPRRSDEDSKPIDNNADAATSNDDSNNKFSTLSPSGIVMTDLAPEEESGEDQGAVLITTADK